MLTEDWAVDVKKYVPDADDGIIGGIVRYCGIALRKVDSSLVAFSDPKETARVRDGYCRKKLALTESDADVDAAIAAVGERMKADRTKNRVTVYYLLAEHFGKLGLFAPKVKAAAARTAGAAAAGAGVAAVAATAIGAAGSVSSATPDAPADAGSSDAESSDGAALGLMGAAGATAAAAAAMPAAAATGIAGAASDAVEAVADGMSGAGTAAVGMAAAGAAAVGAAAASAMGTEDEPDRPQPAAAAGAAATGGGFSPGLLLGILALIIGAVLLLWFLSNRTADAPDAATTQAGASASTDATGSAAATPAPTVTPPEGAGVVATEVAGRPMVSVFFDTSSALIAADFPTAVAPVLAWLQANPGDRAQISGFNDPRGNAAFNADLSRRRAEGVAAELRRMGVTAGQIDLEPPAAATDTTTNLAGARRVEITIVPGT